MLTALLPLTVPQMRSSRRTQRRRSLGDDAAYVPRWKAAKLEREARERELQQGGDTMKLMGGLQGFVDAAAAPSADEPAVMGPGVRMKSDGDLFGDAQTLEATLLDEQQQQEQQEKDDPAVPGSPLVDAYEELKEEIQAMRRDEAEKDEELRLAQARSTQLEAELEEVP